MGTHKIRHAVSAFSLAVSFLPSFLPLNFSRDEQRHNMWGFRAFHIYWPARIPKRIFVQPIGTRNVREPTRTASTESAVSGWVPFITDRHRFGSVLSFWRKKKSTARRRIRWDGSSIGKKTPAAPRIGSAVRDRGREIEIERESASIDEMAALPRRVCMHRTRTVPIVEEMVSHSMPRATENGRSRDNSFSFSFGGNN